MKSSIFTVEKIAKKFTFKALNGKFLKPERKTFYKDVFANGVKYDPETLWDVHRIGNVFTFQNDVGEGFLKGGREIPNAENKFRENYSYWVIKCAN